MDRGTFNRNVDELLGYATTYEDVVCESWVEVPEDKTVAYFRKWWPCCHKLSQFSIDNDEYDPEVLGLLFERIETAERNHPCGQSETL